MKVNIKQMYDAVKAIEIEELTKKLESVECEFVFEDPSTFITFLDSDDEEHNARVERAFLRHGKPFLTVRYNDWESVTIDCECVAYGHLSCVADNIIPEYEVKVSVECTLLCTEKERDNLMSNDTKKAEHTTKNILEEGRFDTAYVEIQ